MGYQLVCQLVGHNLADNHWLTAYLLTTFPEVSTSMTLNNLEIQK